VSRPLFALLRRFPLLGIGAALVLAGTLFGFVLRPNPALSPRFNHVMLYVADLDASIDFYSKAFGVRVTQRLDELTVVAADGSESQRSVRMAFLKFPGQEFVLELSEQQVATDVPAPFYQHLGIDVADIETAAVRVQEAGARDFTGIQTVRATGGIVARNAFFRGPDGEFLELMQMIQGEF